LHRSVDVFDCGVVPYGQALEIQHQLHSEVKERQRFGAIMMLQHMPVLTLGKNADPGLVLTHPASLKASGIEVWPSDRGGEVTAHEPGQLVVYPILPLQDLRLPPKRYVDRLLDTVILTLQHFGIAAQTDPDYPGVWVAQDKICAIGIRVKERVSLHGIALNVVNDLKLFHLIVPCGIRERGVTSMQNLLGSTADLSDVTQVWLQKFSEVMDLSVKIQTVDKLRRNP
jgi:lipoate-protein ligase B